MPRPVPKPLSAYVERSTDVARQHSSAVLEAPMLAGARVLQCRRCNTPMRVEHRDGVQLDVCTECGLTWCDDGELDTLVRSHRATTLAAMGPHARGGLGSGLCAICTRRTERFHFHAAPRVQVEACALHGQWIDAWDARHLVTWGRKEARLHVEVARGVYHRRRDRALAWTWSVSMDLISLRVALATVVWLGGRPVTPQHAALAVAWCLSEIFDLPGRLRARLRA